MDCKIVFVRSAENRQYSATRTTITAHLMRRATERYKSTAQSRVTRSKPHDGSRQTKKRLRHGTDGFMEAPEDIDEELPFS